MLFNSFQYIFAFLPVVFLAFFYLIRKVDFFSAKCWLVAASLFFYSWWNVVYLPLILGSILFNYALGRRLQLDLPDAKRKALLIAGVSGNLLLLGYFKYADFFIETGNYIFRTDFPELNPVLPIAISFFTFQQIAFLADSYGRKTSENDFINYSLFVTFFPQLIAGPIVHHKEMLSQFARQSTGRIDYKNISTGLFVFAMGLFKKVAIADTFASWATPGFDHSPSLTFLEGWAVSLSYAFQLYFDFSGYADMALGAALLFNIRLPYNFDSPYKATDIADFWRRWHITLGRFFKDYVYIPLGGNQKGICRTLANLAITFFLVGLWHGQEWMFVFWGLLHGSAMIVHRAWKKLNVDLPDFIAWFITFNFVNVAWVFFRAESWDDALKVLKAMFGFNGFGLSYYQFFPEMGPAVFGFMLALTFSTLLFFRNSNSYIETRPDAAKMILAFFVLLSISYLNISKTSEFLYFRF